MQKKSFNYCKFKTTLIVTRSYTDHFERRSESADKHDSFWSYLLLKYADKSFYVRSFALGPTSSSMWALGDKVASSIIAQTLGILTLPWSGSGESL